MKERKSYRGLLTRKEREVADKRLLELQNEIPIYEEALFEKYSTKNNLYRYELGMKLNTFLSKHNVSKKERSYYWEEIKEYASSEKNITKDRSSKRIDYEYCYQLFTIGLETVKKLSWRQWQDFLDRKHIRADERIYIWINELTSKVRQDDWRDFTKALNIYFKERDTSIFSKDELFGEMNRIYEIITNWRYLVEKYFSKIDKMTKARRDNKTKYKKMYYDEAIANSNSIFDSKELSDICETIFIKLYLIQKKED